MRSLTLLLFVLAAWTLPPSQSGERIAGSAGELREPKPERSPACVPQQMEGETQSVEPADLDEGPPPGREDPDQFYRKPPRKPRQLRQVNA